MHFHDENIKFNYTLVNFTWSFVSYDKKTISFKLSFFEPLYISPLEVQDWLVVQFRDPLVFMSEKL
jgi:hypothetical protein